MGNQNARTHGLTARYVPIVAVERALELPPGDLRVEIAVIRAALAEAMQGELSGAELLRLLEVGMGTLSRLMHTNKKLDSAAQDELRDGVERALAELELGEA